MLTARLVRQAGAMHATLAATIPHELFTSTIPIAEKVLRPVAVYLGILLLLRVAGKRDLARIETKLDRLPAAG